ncbi:hypothetical protein PX52LOC_05024 [Limnoglobus roseus]|uniref:Uncharacterized protein n=2 Tax=Limnoglobus roseus TaxID=2598579 RepID=A0A5C1AGR0_9BACT|nr:hypothetical protein PX52LOC_05024 [Limnoglobus roseus]
MVIALLLALPLMLLGLVSGWQQVRGLKALYARKLVPSDEFAYLRGRYRRRLVVGLLLVLIGGMIAGAFVSGMEARADEMGEKKPTDADGEKPPITPTEKQFLRWYGIYWMGVMALTFFVIGLAMADGIATRRYWLKIYREMREEHNSQLRRDLAVYRQQKEQNRGSGGNGGSNEGYGGRLGSGPH